MEKNTQNYSQNSASNSETANGKCLCGSVDFKFQVDKKVFDVCHCSMCRKWNGGPGFGVSPSNVPTINGEENVQYYSSSDWAERAFCKKCGTHLFYRMKDKSFFSFQLGTLDGNDEYQFHMQIYTDSKPKNYSFAEKTKMMTEAEVISAFSQKPE